EEGFEAVGESVLALDDRVERARASVETALNELGLTVPSESTPGGQQQQGSSSEQQRQPGGDAEEAETIEEGGATGTSPGVTTGGKRPRWWIPEKLRPSPVAM
ncbi:unnamed protein product, partial [Ectocarpus sp. 12 AP-2014]